MDTEATLPLPQERPNFVGPADLESDLATLVGNETVAGGWIIEGPEGIGKTTLAFRLARSLLSHPDDRQNGLAVSEQSLVFKLIAGNAHPDLRVAARVDKKTGRGRSADIIVDTIHEEVLRLLQRTPAMNDWRIVIIDEADAMNKSAVNALLKILEEPPAKSVLLLTSATPAAMPSTIRSRCRRIRLTPRPLDEIKFFLAEERREIKGNAAHAIALAARGRPGRAAILASRSGASAVECVREFLERVGEGLPLRASRALIAPQDDELWEFFVELLLERLAERTVELAQLPIPRGGEVALLLSTFDEAGRLLRRGVELNLDRGQLLLGVARAICRNRPSASAAHN